MIRTLYALAHSRRDLILEVVRFGVVGGASAVVYALTIVICVFGFGVGVAVATIPGYLASMVLNYTLQKIWTFRSDAAHITSVPKYLFVHIVGIGINYGAVEALMSLVGLHYLIAQAIAVTLVAIWSYFAQKYWTFAVKAAG